MKSINQTPKMLCIALMALFLAGCKEQIEEDPVATGLLSMQLDISVIVPNDKGSLKAATLDDFKVFVYTTDDNLQTSFDRVADVPDPLELPEGSYYVEVSSDNLVEAAFESPFYLGVSEDFTVTAGETTTVDIVCSLANLMASVVYSQQVLDHFDSYTTTVSTSAGSLVFDENEARRGFFNIRPLHIEATLSYTDGGGTLQTKTLTGDISNPQARRHYEIHVDASKDAANGSLNISLDTNSVTEVVELNESDPMRPPTAEVIITEFMANPESVDDATGEWMELYNTTTADIDLEGYTVDRVGNSAQFTISGSLIVPANGYVVLAINSLATTQADYIYSGFLLTNSGMQIQLLAPDGSRVFDITYTSSKVRPGVSTQLDPASVNASDYSNMSNWCFGSVAYDTGDLGSPGTANSSCL